MNRKGSLNLSIEVIIIVVIAFVVLGLGLGFVRGQFSSIDDTTSSVQEQIRQQILDDLRTGNKKLSFPANEIAMEQSESRVIAIGVKNTNSGQLTYQVSITQNGGDPIFGEYSATDQTDVTDNFLYVEDDETLGSTEARVVPIRITADTATGTGQFKIQISEVVDGGEPQPYDSKTFFITVS